MSVTKQTERTQAPPQVVDGALQRRAFFRWVAALGGLATSALAGVPALLAFTSPALRPVTRQSWVKVGEAGLFDIGVPDRVDYTENGKDAWVSTRTIRSVWVYTEDGEKFVAYNGKCPHLGCAYALDESTGHFRCPCHNGVFDMKTGAVLSGPPPRGLDTLETKVEDGVVFVAYQDFQLGVSERIAT